MIEQRLTGENIPFELIPTGKALDTFFFARDLDFDKYSLLVAAGGDGTYHEVVNGMLARDDKKKIPIGLIPNGSGNDLCTSLGFKTLDEALDYIVNREVTKVDTVRVLIDHENEESLPEDINERVMFCRHMMINSALAFPAKIANEAIPWKACCGKASYTIATLIEAIKCGVQPDHFNIFIDGVLQKMDTKNDVQTILFMLFNGKNTGAGMILNPFAVMNDGLLDATWLHDENKMGVLGIADLLDKAAKKGGVQTYENVVTHVRGKQIRIEFTGSDRKKPTGGFGQQLIGIDGEDLRFNNYVIYDAMPGNVEFLFDSASFFRPADKN